MGARPGRLTLADREEITLGLHAGQSFTGIAGRLGKAPSMVSREVAANGGRGDYRAWRAHQRACQQARRPKAGKLAFPQLAAKVTCWLTEWWSPVQISARLRIEFPGDPMMNVSHEGTVALCHLCTGQSMIGMLRWSDGECQVVEDDAKPVSAGGVGGDVVVAAAQVLHEGVTDGEGPC